MRSFTIWSASSLAVFYCVPGRTIAASYPVIDESLTVSQPTGTPISEIDTDSYDRFVLKVDGEPFFYNGIQVRLDKLHDVWGVQDSALKSLIQTVADDGFTVVNSQIHWSHIQPDSIFNASESTYIQGGSLGSTNFASSTTSKIGYTKGDESNKELTYIKLNFTGYTESEITAAKLRIYIDKTVTTAFTGNLYGITNNSWTASEITWKKGAPNHDGVEVAGTEGEDIFFASSSPSWDLIKRAQYYDFDASDFIKNQCPDRIASFILQAATNSTTAVGATLHGAKGTHPPQLVISNKNKYDWSYIDKVLSWVQSAGLKFEIIWFGSDSTSVTMDSRVPYYVFQYTKNEEVNSDGTHTPVFAKNTDPTYGIYWYLMDKNDLALRKQEKAVLKALLNHIAEFDSANGSIKTLIGVDVANEPGVQKLHGSSFTAWQNPATWGALSNFSSVEDFVNRTRWEFTVNLANAVKESNYPTWTRSNDYYKCDAPGAQYNELTRSLATHRPTGAGGTKLQYLNIFQNVTSTTTKIRSISTTYTSTINGTGIADERSSKEIALLSTLAGSFTLSNIASYTISSVQAGAYSVSDDSWVKSRDVSYSTSGKNVTFSIIEGECIRVLVGSTIPSL